MNRHLRLFGVWLCLASAWIGAAQIAPHTRATDIGSALDPACAVWPARTVAMLHTPALEEYLWTAHDAAVVTQKAPLRLLKRNDWKVEPHFFRRTFTITTKPQSATLYVAGPRSARVWIDGSLAAELQYKGRSHIGFAVMTADVSAALQTGRNVIAIEAVRGFGSHHHTNSLRTSWLNSGEVLAVKILPAPEGVNASPLLISDNTWKSAAERVSGWERPDFNDAAWEPVTSLGGIESDVDFFQWNADAGMYSWPGYLGEAPYMANCRLRAVKAEQQSSGRLLDFGRELNGRILITAGAHMLRARVRYGESIGELLRAPYLAEFPLMVPAGHTGRGPKSGFRYALVTFDEGGGDADISAEAIYYPELQAASFESSDGRLNRIWETAAYTAHLSMQDSILDGIKRDRGRWAGDNEVIDRVIADVYGDGKLVKSGLEDAIGPEPVTEHVNGLPGYSAWWVVTEAEYVRRWGDLQQLRGVKRRLLELLARMERELNAQSLYTAASGAKPFVDWAAGLSGDSPEARRAVHFEYMLAFRQAAWLLRLAGDEPDAARYSLRADAMGEAAQKYLMDSDGTFGDRWQTNAIAVLAGAAENNAERKAAWRVLARTLNGRKPGDVITPYYGSYLLTAMAELGHRQEALTWMRTYWGGMLDAGATSFWEAWDPAWAGGDPHAQMQADGKVGYNASLAHGWSSGPAAWLMEELLGVKAVEPGYRAVQVRPELAGLQWMRGAVSTPLGAVRVEANEKSVAVTIPPGMVATLLLPKGRWLQDGVAINTESAEDGGRMRIVLRQSGKFEFMRP